jgi:hypothetical protein
VGYARHYSLLYSAVHLAEARRMSALAERLDLRYAERIEAEGAVVAGWCYRGAHEPAPGSPTDKRRRFSRRIKQIDPGAYHQAIVILESPGHHLSDHRSAMHQVGFGGSADVRF